MDLNKLRGMYVTDYSPLLLSLKVAGISTFFVFIFGVFFAHLFSRKKFFGKSIIESLFMLPLVLPPTVVGFGLLILFGKNGFIGSWLLNWFDFQVVFTWIGAVIASIVVSFPLMYQSAAAAFESLDAEWKMRLVRWVRRIGVYFGRFLFDSLGRDFLRDLFYPLRADSVNLVPR